MNRKVETIVGLDYKIAAKSAALLLNTKIGIYDSYSLYIKVGKYNMIFRERPDATMIIGNLDEINERRVIEMLNRIADEASEIC